MEHNVINFKFTSFVIPLNKNLNLKPSNIQYHYVLQNQYAPVKRHVHRSTVPTPTEIIVNGNGVNNKNEKNSRVVRH